MLLAHAAFVAPRRTMSGWIQAAMSHGGHLAAALDLSATARQLVDCGLAKEGTWIEIAPQLSALVANEQGPALRDVAQLLLMSSPPPWVRLVVSETGVAREYIPKEDLAALGWLEPDLDRCSNWVMQQLSAAETASQNEGHRRCGRIVRSRKTSVRGGSRDSCGAVFRRVWI